MKRRESGTLLLAALSTLVAVSSAIAETLKVGPGQKFAKPSQAIAAGKDGDVIELDTKGKYEGDVTYVNASNLTIRGVGEGRALLDAQGKVAGRKGIFVTRGKNTTIENIEFRNAGGEVNAAGIRAEGPDLTIRNCKFFECRDAILGGAGEVLIEHSEFSHCGHNSNPATHNLYMSERVTKLTYRYNYSHFTYEGHLLKSRARENWILYNRVTDEDGQGSAVTDFPNGGLVVLVGNTLHKGPKGQNNRMVVFGMEGLKHERNELYVVNNSMWWDNRRPNEMAFVYVRTVAARPAGSTSQPATKDVKAVIRNNLCVGALKLTNHDATETAGNLLLKTPAEAGFADPATFDFRLRAGSPAIDKAVEPGKVGEFSLKPILEYAHPHNVRQRPDDGKLDVGAFEFVR
jgi:hypothetical protein